VGKRRRLRRASVALAARRPRGEPVTDGGTLSPIFRYDRLFIPAFEKAWMNSWSTSQTAAPRPRPPSRAGAGAGPDARRGRSMSGSGLSPRDRREIGSTGIMVSPLGFGASPLGNEFGAIDVRRASAPPAPHSRPGRVVSH
jgi:hypothetical protein